MSPTRSSIRVRLLLALGFVALCFAALPVAPAVATAAEPAKSAALDPASTYAVIVGVLHWENKGLTPYPVEKRKDQELYDTLRKRGVPADNLAILLDEKATLASIRKELEAVAGKAKPNSTLIFYYAGHGWRTGNGDTAFANYDYHAGKADKPALALSEVGDAIAKHFKGARVLCFADCCHSGGLQDVAKKAREAKLQAAALTSADAICTSTNNWTFTQTLVDGFAGDPFLDANGDGTITLGELAGEVSLAMQYRDRQRYGFATEGLSADFKLAAANTDKKVPGPLQGDFALREYVHAKDGGKQRTGRIVGFKDDKYAVEFFTYNDKETSHLPASALGKIGYKIYKVGDLVAFGRRSGPKAKVVEVAGAFHLVSFPDQPNRPRQWVLGDRLGDAAGGAAAETRNPFGVEDVDDPTGKDVKDFAESAKLPGGDKDENAEQWVKDATEGKAGALDGEWQSRWSGGKGTVKVKVIKDRVYFLSEETEGDFKGRKYLLEAVRDKDKLMGRWMDVANAADSGPFAGLIVGDDRIDGAWAEGARWDFRRKLKK